MLALRKRIALFRQAWRTYRMFYRFDDCTRWQHWQHALRASRELMIVADGRVWFLPF